MAAPVSPSTNQFITKTFWDTEIYNRWVDAYGTWTSYTPIWLGATTNPVLGNGSLVAAYKRLDTSKTVHIRLRLVPGSTTTYGSGLWSLSLPVGLFPSAIQTINGFVGNDTGSARYPMGVYLNGTDGMFRFAINGTSGVAPTVPFTWAASYQLVVNGTYEIP